MTTTQSQFGGAARSMADVTKGTVVASVEIAATPERVFRALTSEEITKWWGSPEMYRVTKWTGEVKPGGAWRSDGIGSDGQPFFVSGTYLEVEPPHRVVQTWIAPWDGNNTTTITYRVEAIQGGSRVTIEHTGFGDRTESCNSHGEGWTRVFGWLSKYLHAV